MGRAGGPDAIVLREATRRTGVAPNAAYRHFADRHGLQSAVSMAARGMVAAAMADEQEHLPAVGDACEAARARMIAVGVAYLRFAQTEPGWFRTAFTVPTSLVEGAAEGDLSPFAMLADALDEMVVVGALAPDRRAGPVRGLVGRARAGDAGAGGAAPRARPRPAQVRRPAGAGDGGARALRVPFASLLSQRSVEWSVVTDDDGGHGSQTRQTDRSGGTQR